MVLADEILSFGTTFGSSDFVAPFSSNFGWVASGPGFSDHFTISGASKYSVEIIVVQLPQFLQTDASVDTVLLTSMPRRIGVVSFSLTRDILTATDHTTFAIFSTSVPGVYGSSKLPRTFIGRTFVC